VSFGSSKGSMVETLVYDHQEDLSELPAFLTAAPVTNGCVSFALAINRIYVCFP
ncbi:hypothetical protein AVEN_182667-1, partial [Araneus ventricosus]